MRILDAIVKILVFIYIVIIFIDNANTVLYDICKEKLFMAQRNICIRMDEELKEQFDQFCMAVGMTMTTAITVFAIAAVKEQRIPFEISAPNEPFYSKQNIDHLHSIAAEVESGKARYVAKTLTESMLF